MAGNACGRRSLAFQFLMLMICSEATASAWNTPNGQVFAISRLNYFRADLDNVSVAGAPVEARFERAESYTYGEYGVASDISVGAQVFYGTSWLTRGTTTLSASGFSEIEAFAQYQLARDSRNAAAVKFAIGVPSDFSAGVRPALATDGVDLEIAALYGRTLTYSPIATFIAAEATYRKRTGAAADQARLLTTLGANIGTRATILIDTFSVRSLRNEDPGGADFDVVKIQPSFAFNFTRRWGVQVGVNREIAGRNLDLGTTYFVGLQSRF